METTNQGATPEIAPANPATSPTPATGTENTSSASGVTPIATEEDEAALSPTAKALIAKLRGESRDTQRELKTLRSTQEAAQKVAEDAQKASQVEQGKFKELYEAETARREKAESAAQSLEHERLLDRVAAKYKLPESLRSRLHGATEEELDADAEGLAKLLLPTNPTPTTRPGASPAPNPAQNGQQTPVKPRALGLF